MTEWAAGRARTRWPWQDVLGTTLLGALALIGLVSLIVPTIIIVITSFDTRQIISFPPEGLGLDRYRRMFGSSELRSSVLLSATVALAAVAIDLLLGIPAAVALVRRRFRGHAMLLAFLLSPMMLPGIVIGIAILFFVSTLGFSPSLSLMTLSHVVLTIPFVIRITMARMERADRRLEESAANLGAGRWQVFRHILVPQLWPGILAGAAFAFLISFDNLTVSLFTAPVLQRPLPVELFYRMRFDLDPVVSAVATCQIVLTLLVLAVAGRMIEVIDASRERQ